MRRLLPLAATLLLASVARAQCPDGTPPPCRTAAAPVRQPPANVALDQQTWIVVPFDNLARNQEIEWLRAASVNLLYLDLSRWSDIKVVDDERVADLMSEVPGARDGPQLSLAAALAVARKAGAGRLVMGDLLKVGNRTAVVAKVFDVRGGRRLRSVREETSVQDSLIATFGKLARGILNVAPAAGEHVGTVGTASIEAYQEYLAGVQALNRFDLTGARRRFTRALQLDSAFALPHYKLSVVIGWENPSDPQRQVHANAAARLGNTLPPRERALVGALRKFSIGDFGGACVDYSALVRADSTDVEALYGVGECSFHDEAIERLAADTSQLRFRSSWNTAVRAFRRVLTLDPGNYLAFQHILDVLGAETRNGCLRPVATEQCRTATVELTGVMRRVADTVVVEPVHFALEGAAFAAQMDEAARTDARRRNLEDARAMAEAWVAVAPDVPRAHTSLGHVYVLLARYDDAERQFALVKGELPTTEAFRLALDRVEIAIRRGRGTEVLTLIDSAQRVYQGKAIPANVSMGLALTNALVGRFARFDTVAASLMVPAVVLRYYRIAIRAISLGTGGDSLVAAEREAFDFAKPGLGATRATSMISPSLLLALRVPRASWPDIAVDPNDKSVLAGSVLNPALALARRDTQTFRRATVALDSAARQAGSGLTRVVAGITAAQAHLLLRDSLIALQLLRGVVDSAFATVALTATANSEAAPVSLFYPRAILDRAEVARGLGFRDEAREWYRRFLELWSSADPEFAPILARIRLAYVEVGGS